MEATHTTYVRYVSLFGYQTITRLLFIIVELVNPLESLEEVTVI